MSAMPAARPPQHSGGRAASFCPACWEQMPATANVCPVCGVDVARHLATIDYTAQLIGALQHPDPRRRRIAASILGERRVTRALAALHALVLPGTRDVFLAAAAAGALARIGGPEAFEILRQVSQGHPAHPVRQAAADALSQSGRAP